MEEYIIKAKLETLEQLRKTFTRAKIIHSINRKSFFIYIKIDTKKYDVKVFIKTNFNVLQIIGGGIIIIKNCWSIHDLHQVVD